jgi:hypothetical protein
MSYAEAITQLNRIVPELYGATGQTRQLAPRSTPDSL